MEYTVRLSAEEEKALLVDMISIQVWLENAIHNRARQCIDKIVLENSEKNPKNTPRAEKLQIVRKAKVKSAAERMAEHKEMGV